MNQPKWAKDEQDRRIKEQITVVQRPGAFTAPVTTGLGADGRFQANKPVGRYDLELHEDEGVVPAHIMRGPVGQKMAKMLKHETGFDIFKNHGKMGPVGTVKMQSGGTVPAYLMDMSKLPGEEKTKNKEINETMDRENAENLNQTQLLEKIGMPSYLSKDPFTQRNYDNPTGPVNTLNQPVSSPSTLNPVTAPSPVKMPTEKDLVTIPVQAAPVVKPPEVTIKNQAVQATPVAQAAAPVKIEEKVQAPPVPVSMAPVQAPAQTTEPAAAPAAVSAAPGTFYDNTAKQMTQQMVDMSRGESEIFENIKNQAFSNLAPQLQIQLTQAAMRIARSPNMTEGAKRAAMGDAMRNVGLAESQLAGQMAQKALDMAMTATGQAFNMAQGQQAYFEGNRRFDIGVQQDAIRTLEDAGDYDTAAKVFEDAYGYKPDYTQLKNAALSKVSNDAAGNVSAIIEENQYMNSGDAWKDPEIKQNLQTMWDNLSDTAKVGTDFDTWAQGRLNNMVYARSPVGKAINAMGGMGYLMTLPGAKGKTEDEIRNAVFGIYSGGGFSIDDKGNWTVDSSNPIWDTYGDLFDPRYKTVEELNTEWNASGPAVQLLADGSYYTRDAGGNLQEASISDVINTVHGQAGAQPGATYADGPNKYTLQADGKTWELTDSDTNLIADVSSKFDFIDSANTNGSLFGDDAKFIMQNGTADQKKKLQDMRVDYVSGSYDLMNKYKTEDPELYQAAVDKLAKNPFNNEGEYKSGMGVNDGVYFKSDKPNPGTLISYGGKIYRIDELNYQSVTGLSDAEYEYIKVKSLDDGKTYYIKPSFGTTSEADYFFSPGAISSTSTGGEKSGGALTPDIIKMGDKEINLNDYKNSIVKGLLLTGIINAYKAGKVSEADYNHALLSLK